MVYHLRHLKKKKSGEINQMRAFEVEIQLPANGTLREQARHIWHKENKNFISFRGRFVVPLRTQQVKDELLAAYPKSSAHRRGGFNT